MKNLKRIFCILIFSFIAFTFFVTNVYATDPIDAITTDGVTYYVGSREDDYNLGYGIKYIRDKSYTRINQSGVISGQISGAGKGGDIEVGVPYSQQVNMLSFKTNEDLKIVPYAVLSGSDWKLSKIVLAAQDYEKNHPGYRVVGGINGDFFNTSVPFGSTGVTVGDGEYYSSHNGHPTIAFKNDGTVNQLFTLQDRSMQYTLTIYDENNTQIYKTFINNINTDPTDNEVNLFFLQRKSSNQLSFWSTQSVTNAWVVKNATQAVTTKINSFYGKGAITEFVNGTYDFTGGKPEFAIKSNNQEVNGYLKEGAIVRVQKEYTSKEAEGCTNFIGSQAQYYVNGSFINGEGNVTQTKTRCPRTVIGIKADGTVMMFVIDGRQYKKGYHGMGSCELSALAKYYGLVNAWNLDGGGSSTLIVRRQETFKPSQTFNDDKTGNWWVVNSPSDGAERSDANCLLLVAKVPELGFKTTKKTETTLSLTITNIEELGKYKDLYILKDDEMKQIENGTIEITNLNPSKIYSFPIYAKINEEYCYLFTKYTDKTALEMATIKNVNYSSVIKNEVISYQLSVSFNNNDCLKSVKFVIGDNEYIIKHSTITLNEDELNLLLTNDYKIVIVYDTENLTGEHTDELTSFEISVKSSIIVLDALVLKTNDLLNSIIK
ncbi:MAG: phosphodiester glycosidase family protein [Acholeplasmataceae bacterium]|nr:phosphodiester glycosidase family protein [Acholeplasmataceae bacterium]